MIRLQFSTNKGIFARLTRWATWGEYSHVDFILPDGKLLGALPEGVEVHSPRKYTKVIVYEVDAPKEVLEMALTQVGKKYDWKGILGFGIKKRVESKNKWFCSELVAWAFEQAGSPLLLTDKHWRISPRDLLLSPRLVKVEDDVSTTS